MAPGVSGPVAAARPHCRRDPGRVCRTRRHGLCVPRRAATAERDLWLSARRGVEAPLLYFNAGYVSAVVRHKVHSEATPVQMVVWDLSSSTYVDVVGARMLADVEEAWARQGIQLRLADAHADVRDILRAEGLEERVSRIDRRMSVDDIVTAFRPVS